MAIPGPISISPSHSTSGPDLGLRPFQRVTAQVLNVTGTTAVLAIEGYAVVAQLTSADQASTLLSQRTAQFIVSKLTSQEVTLKFIRPESSGAITHIPNPNGPELAVRLLEQDNLPVTGNNLSLARAVLAQGLPPASGLLNELLDALMEFGPWGEAQANLAAALKAAGLPVTAESLALVSRQAAETGQALGQLITQLQSTGQSLPPELLEEIRRELEMLKELVPGKDGDTARLSAQLKNAAKVLGQSLEHALLEQAQNRETHPAEGSLLSLARLAGSLGQAGETELAAAIERFLDDLRQQHFLNAKPEPGAWSQIGFRLEGERCASARLGIQRDARANPQDTGPAFTRLVLQVDIHDGETVEVDLALTGQGVRAQVTAPNPVWCQRAESELPTLEQALQGLGYQVKEASVSIGEPGPFEGLHIASGDTPLMTVNIEV